MTDTWTPEAARARLAALQRQCEEGSLRVETYLLRWAGEYGAADLRHALDRIAELEARGAASLRMEGRMRPLPYPLDECALAEGERAE